MPEKNLYNSKLFVIKNNDQRKITEIYNEHRDAFISFSMKNYNLPKDDAEDIYQEAFLAMHQNIQNDKLVNLTVPLRSYLFQIGKYKILDYLKIEQYQVNEDLSNFENIYKDAESDTERRDLIIYNTVNQMESPCKEILSYYYWEEKSMKEIAQLKEYSNADVAKTQKSKCMKKVKAYILEKLKKAGLI
ncbi:MAG: sigma-70 family RNA polymerase sigma factor [Candidatus Symbiothrix sp.]|jgi:RNA polymerase sigma factor (sigma-70 family)|nr:sigma-70 family RNA polymerase sigma factor [Candidatus Symbiothrix sp.]